MTGGQPSRGRQLINFSAAEVSNRKEQPGGWSMPNYQAPAPAVRPLTPVRQQQAAPSYAHQYPYSTGQSGITGNYAHQYPNSNPARRNSRSPAGNRNRNPSRLPAPQRQVPGVVVRPPPFTPGNPMATGFYAGQGGRSPSRTGRNPSRGGAAVSRGQSGGQPQSRGQSRGGQPGGRPQGQQPRRY